jgi:hypothetical protein
MRAALLLVLLLSACAKVTEMRDPDGGTQYLVGCYGALTPMSVCYNKADDLCPAGYTIIDQKDTTSSSVTQQAGIQSIARQMVIKCS